MPSRTKRTEPSPSRKFAPPECRLPKDAFPWPFVLSPRLNAFSGKPGLLIPKANRTVSISRRALPPVRQPLHPPLSLPPAHTGNAPSPVVLGLTFSLSVTSPTAIVLLSPSVTAVSFTDQLLLLSFE